MTTKCNGACIVHCGGAVNDGAGVNNGGGWGGRDVQGAKEDTCLIQKKAQSKELPSKEHGACPSSFSSSIPARYVLAAMSFTGFISIFTLRMDLNVAIIAITGGADNKTGTQDNMTLIRASTTDWSEEKQNMALSAFYYGYCSTQILGGYLSGIVGATRIMGYSVMVTSLVSLVTPSAIMEGYYLLVLCRVIQGMAQGLAQPCMHTIWSKWAPKQEKTKLMTFSFSGSQLGNIVATVATGYMCGGTSLLHWTLVFYVFGSVGMVWSVTWLLLIHETPRRHPRITKAELVYIEQTTVDIQDKKWKTKPPWRQMVLTPAFLAIMTAQFANDWGYLALSTCLPLYMQHVLKYDIKQNGFLSSLPFIVLLFANPLAGFLADWLIARQVLSTKNCRKALNSVGLLVPSVLMVGVCFVGLNQQLIVPLLTLALGFTGFTIAGYTVNHLDIMPPFAGLSYSVSNTIGTTTGFIGPAIVSVLTKNHDTFPHWRIFFSITAAIFFIGGAVFLVFAEGEPRPWVLRHNIMQKDLLTPGSRLGENEDYNERIHHQQQDRDGALNKEDHDSGDEDDGNNNDSANTINTSLPSDAGIERRFFNSTGINKAAVNNTIIDSNHACKKGRTASARRAGDNYKRINDNDNNNNNNNTHTILGVGSEVNGFPIHRYGSIN